MEKRLVAITSVASGVGLGIIADILFYRKTLGISFPLFVAASLAALFVFARAAGSPSRRRNLWILAPLAFFAVMVAVRANASLIFFDIAAVLWLAGLFLHYRPLTDPADEATLREQSAAVSSAALAAVSAPALLLPEAAVWLRDRRPVGNGRWKPVGRGLLITAPIVLIFGILLGSADVVFGSYLGDIVGSIALPGLDDMLAQALIVCAFGWLAAGVLSYGVSLRHAAATPAPVRIEDEIDALFEQPLDSVPEKEKPKRDTFRLSMIETGMALGAVNLLFGAFVVVQFAYFFGGRENIALDGFTYAEYARRGFFELLAVSVMTLGLVLWLDSVTVRATPGERKSFLALAAGVVIFTSVILVSASGRMTLYHEAYGFTHLRVYTHIFMLWLGILFAVFLVGLFRPQRRIFPIGVMLCTLGFLATLNHIDVDATIARQNIARYRAGHELDVNYFYMLSEDAVPEVLQFYETLEDGPIREQVGRWLAFRKSMLESTRESASLFSAHVSRDAAWALLSQVDFRTP